MNDEYGRPKKLMTCRTIIDFGRSENPKLVNSRRMFYRIRGLARIRALASIHKKGDILETTGFQGDVILL
jgi:hypothetical protein